MQYDPLGESLRLLEQPEMDNHASPLGPERLTTLTSGVDGDLAATAFARTGTEPDEVNVDVWLLHRSKSGWRLLGGSSVVDEWPSLLTRQPAEKLGAYLVVDRSGDGLYGERRLGRFRRSAGYAFLRASSEVERVTVRKRSVAVPANGLLLIPWHGDTPAVQAVSRSGRVLQRLLPS